MGEYCQARNPGQVKVKFESITFVYIQNIHPYLKDMDTVPDEVTEDLSLRTGEGRVPSGAAVTILVSCHHLPK